MVTQPRKPPGSSEGGRFDQKAHSDADVSLGSPLDERLDEVIGMLEDRPDLAKMAELLKRMAANDKDEDIPLSDVGELELLGQKMERQSVLALGEKGTPVPYYVHDRIIGRERWDPDDRVSYRVPLHMVVDELGWDPQEVRVVNVRGHMVEPENFAYQLNQWLLVRDSDVQLDEAYQNIFDEAYIRMLRDGEKLEESEIMVGRGVDFIGFEADYMWVNEEIGIRNGVFPLPAQELLPYDYPVLYEDDVADPRSLYEEAQRRVYRRADDGSVVLKDIPSGSD